MKTLLLIAPLVLGACVTPGSVPLDVDGPVARTIERVLQRTEAYMAMESPPVSLSVEMQEQVSASVEVVRAMLLLPEASGAMLLVTMAPIMDLHDWMVSMDPELAGEEGQLEREIYLESTARLRSLFNSVNIHVVEPVPAQ